MESSPRIGTCSLLGSHTHNFVLMITSYLVILSTALIRGGHGNPSIVGFEQCSLENWGTLFVSLSMCVLISFTAFKLNEKYLAVLDSESKVNPKTLGKLSI